MTTAEMRVGYLESDIENEYIEVINQGTDRYQLYCKVGEDSIRGTLDLEYNGKSMYLHYFNAYVTRVGIGTRLMKKALEICDSLGRDCTLIITPDNLEISYEALSAFYQKFGFHETQNKLFGKPVYERKAE